MIEIIVGVGLLLLGIGAMVGIFRFAPGYHKVWGLPTGFVLILIGAAIAGWIDIPWLNFIG